MAVLRRLVSGSELTPFEKAHGMGFWDLCYRSPKFNAIFNENYSRVFKRGYRQIQKNI